MLRRDAEVLECSVGDAAGRTGLSRMVRGSRDGFLLRAGTAAILKRESGDGCLLKSRDGCHFEEEQGRFPFGSRDGFLLRAGTQGRIPFEEQGRRDGFLLKSRDAGMVTRGEKRDGRDGDKMHFHMRVEEWGMGKEKQGRLPFKAGAGTGTAGGVRRRKQIDTETGSAQAAQAVQRGIINVHL
ncbi:hypothetical protein BDR04DRAFT_1119964 [Suillus decipiens]|nr:hypothetical protein BDR04DRAFT_1119964 [Suillus decipiens]